MEEGVQWDSYQIHTCDSTLYSETEASKKLTAFQAAYTYQILF